MTAIFKREFKAYFSTPVGYIILALYFLFLGLNFRAMYSYGIPEVENVISGVSVLVVFGIPILTMRLISEDRRQKTDQILFTSPVGLKGIVLGKFLAALSVFAICFIPSVVYEIIVAAYVEVNVLLYVYSLFGMLLLGAAFIAMGMFISSLTESPVVAAIVTFIANILTLYMTSLASFVNNSVISSLLEKLAFIEVYQNFTSAVFSVGDVLYLLSITAIFLVLSVCSLESRRYA